MKQTDKIYVAGHLGLVGSAIWKNLQSKGYTNLIGRSIDEMDLMDQSALGAFFKQEKPDYVILAAAKVGGIMANNTYRGQFIYENLQIQNNIIHQSYLHGVKKFLFLGSSCIYPKNAPQPLKEEYLLSGELEYTNEPYAIAKIAGIKMCESYNLQYGTNFVSVMPTNLFGPNDNYNLETSHVLPAILRKVYLAKCLESNNWNAIRNDLNKRPIEGINRASSKEDILNIFGNYGIHQNNILRSQPDTNKLNHITITLWGSGQVYREFMHVDDMASACVKVMKELDISDFTTHSQRIESNNSSSIMFLNIGTGFDLSIQDLARKIKKIVGFKGEIRFDKTHADGTYKKLLDVSRLRAIGFKTKYTLDEGIQKVYQDYKSEVNLVIL